MLLGLVFATANTADEGDGTMAWIWRYEGANAPEELGASEPFPSQSDAESWLGQNWRSLLDTGVVTAVLMEDERVEYRMGLLPVSE
jgi:hypothetical protein